MGNHGSASHAIGSSEADFALSQLQKPHKIKAGDVIYYTEDVFVTHEGKPKFLGVREVVCKVVGIGKLPGYVSIQILKSSGANADTPGIVVDKPIANLLRGFEVPADKQNGSLFKSGGHLEGIDASGKKVILDHAYKGGIYKGSKHSEGGIKGVVGNEQRPIEVEADEISLAPEVSDDSSMYEFNGKKMPAKEILSILNQKNGGVALARGGFADTGTDQNPLKYKGKEIILTAPVTSDATQFEFEGKKMTPRQIASAINVKNGGVAFASGGKVSGCMCSGKSFDFGGKTMTDFQIIDEINNCGCEHSEEKGYDWEKKNHYEALSKLNGGTLTIDGTIKAIVKKNLELDPNYYN